LFQRYSRKSKKYRNFWIFGFIPKSIFLKILNAPKNAVALTPLDLSSFLHSKDIAKIKDAKYPEIQKSQNLENPVVVTPADLC